MLSNEIIANCVYLDEIASFQTFVWDMTEPNLFWLCHGSKFIWLLRSREVNLQSSMEFINIVINPSY